MSHFFIKWNENCKKYIIHTCLQMPVCARELERSMHSSYDITEFPQTAEYSSLSLCLSLSLSVSLSLSILTTIFPGEPGLAGFTGAKDNGGGGNNWSHKTCKALVKSSTNKPTPNFLQAGCPSCCPTNSTEALKGKLQCTAT